MEEVGCQPAVSTMGVNGVGVGGNEVFLGWVVFVKGKGTLWWGVGRRGRVGGGGSGRMRGGGWGGSEVAMAHWVCKGGVFGWLPGAQSVRHLTRVSVYLVEAALGPLLLLEKQSNSEKH